MEPKKENEKAFALRNENLPAFPTEFSYGDSDFLGAPVIAHGKYAGISKKEYFAAKALEGAMSKWGAVDFTASDAKRLMVAVDLMMKECDAFRSE